MNGFLRKCVFGHRRRASVSILLVIVVPSVLLMGLFLYDLLLLRHREAKALKVIFAVSEAKLAQYNEYLSSDRGIQANLDIGTTSEYFSYYLRNNGIRNSVVQIDLKSLDNPRNFEYAVVRSMMTNVGSIALQSLLDRLGIIEVVKGIADKLEALDKKLEGLYALLEFPKKISKKLDSDSLGEVKAGVEWIQQLMKEREETFYEKKTSIEEELPEISLAEVRDEKGKLLERLIQTWQEYHRNVDRSLLELNRYHTNFLPNQPMGSSGGTSPGLKTEQEVIAFVREQFRDWSFYKEDNSSGIIAQIKKGFSLIKRSFGSFATEGGILAIKGSDYAKVPYRSNLSLLEKMAMVEWVARNLSSYSKESEKKGTIRGEAEYVITGKTREQDSVSRIRLEIAGIRLIPNLITFSKSKVKEQVTNVLGILPPPVNYIALGIAYSSIVIGESYIDSGRLLQGDEFLFIKKEEDWRLSLDGLTKGVFEELTTANKESKKKTGMTLDYLDYLRVLLLLESSENIVLRSMNVVQTSIDRVSRGSYSLADYAIGHRVRVVFSNQSIISNREAEIEFENSYD